MVPLFTTLVTTKAATVCIGDLRCLASRNRAREGASDGRGVARVTEGERQSDHTRTEEEGGGLTSAATRPEMWAISAISTAPHCSGGAAGRARERARSNGQGANIPCLHASINSVRCQVACKHCFHQCPLLRQFLSLVVLSTLCGENTQCACEGPALSFQPLLRFLLHPVYPILAGVGGWSRMQGTERRMRRHCSATVVYFYSATVPALICHCSDGATLLHQPTALTAHAHCTRTLHTQHSHARLTESAIWRMRS